MQTENNISTKQKIRMIYNNDCAVIDFLADLQDRKPLKALQRFIDFGNQQSIGLLYNCPPDDLVLVILYKAPFGFNEGTNKLMLYAHRDIMALIRYFKAWFEATSKDNKAYFDALKDITSLLYNQWIEEQEKPSRSDLPG